MALHARIARAQVHCAFRGFRDESVVSRARLNCLELQWRSQRHYSLVSSRFLEQSQDLAAQRQKRPQLVSTRGGR